MDISALQLTLRRFAGELLQLAEQASISLHDGPGPKTHVLVDWENVQPSEADCRALVPEATDVWLFHGPTQRNVGNGYTAFGDRVTPVKIARAGKNALDFHLSFYMGYIASKHPDARFVVLSNDKGYGPMLDHAKELGFVASQSGFGRVRAARPAGTTTARKTGAKRPAAAKKAAAVAPAARKTAAKKAAQPQRQSTASSASSSAAKKTPATSTAAPPTAPAAKKASRQAAKAPAAGTAKTAPRAAKSPRAARTTPAAKNAPPAKTAAAAPAPAKKSFEQVVAMLKKSPAANRPQKHNRLLAYVTSRVGLASEAQARAMLERLAAEGVISVDDKWNVSYRL